MLLFFYLFIISVVGQVPGLFLCGDLSKGDPRALVYWCFPECIMEIHSFAPEKEGGACLLPVLKALW